MHPILTIPRDDPSYPRLLGEIHDPPATLYVRGAWPLSERPWLAVVGTRKPSMYGRRATSDLIEPAARAGIGIVSGMAFGIDTAAHLSAIRIGAPTVAVLGAGVDDESLYPRGNAELAKQILDHGGTLLSELPPGTKVHPFHFPVRNRIIAGLCKATLIIEATIKSGTLITARLALEENREVLAVPGPITSLASEGPNNLIKMGARPITSVADLLAVYDLQTPESAAIQAGSAEEAAILAILTREPKHVDDLVTESSLPTPVVLRTLTLMEMKGSAIHAGGQHYVHP